VASKNGDFRIWVPKPKSLLVVVGIFFPMINAGLGAQLFVHERRLFTVRAANLIASCRHFLI